MQEFKVTVKEVWECHYLIEANSEDEAKEIAVLTKGKSSNIAICTGRYYDTTSTPTIDSVETVGKSVTIQAPCIEQTVTLKLLLDEGEDECTKPT